MARPVTGLITTLSRSLGLDPRAVIAVARGEGGLVNRPGTQDIGDLAGGGSYGPFQLYAKGALPRRFRGNMAAADQWAWSPAGIQYALSQMAPYARGRTGADAVKQIITKFERPLDPQGSIAKALARLGSSVPVSAAPRLTPSREVARSGSNALSPIVSAILNDTDLFDALMATEAPVSPSKPLRAAPGLSGDAPGDMRFRGLTELIHDPVGSIFDGVRSNKPYGGHGSHVHAAFTNPQSVLAAIELAQRLGLSVRENPYTDPVDPVHTKGSQHYRVFPGKYKGRRLGQAVDVSGNPKLMRRFYQLLAGGK